MKKLIFQTAAILMFAAIIQSCNAEKLTSDIIDKTTDMVDNLTEYKKPKNLKEVSKTYDLSNFHSIKNDVALDIEYTQTDKYDVRIVGDEETLKTIKVGIEEGELYIKPIKRNHNGSWKTLKLYLSAPMLTSIKNDGSMIFNFSSIKTNDIDIENDGSMRLNGNNIDCNNMKLSSDGLSRYNCNINSQGDITVEIDGSGKLSGNLKAANLVRFSIDGIGKIKGDIKSKDAVINVEGSANFDSKIESDYLKISTDGLCSAEMSFKGKKIDIKNDGSGKMKINCNCTDLRASNDGVAKIILEGTVDNINIKSDGVSKIDTSKLNNVGE